MKKSAGYGPAKRLLAAVLCAAAAVSAAGCGSVRGSAELKDGSDGAKKLSVVCTGFSEYDWTKNMLAGNSGEIELTYLLQNGTDMHSYQPTAADMAKISSCDLFIYAGGESQKWAEDALKNSSCRSVRLLDVLEQSGSAKTEEIKEGMQAEEEDEKEEGGNGAPEFDEHVWLTPGNAELFTKSICGGLKEIDPANAAAYEAAADEYIAKLETLKTEYADTLSACASKTVIVADRFPFRYLADEYGLDYYAAFAGCSAETEASFETVAFLSKKIDETNAGTVFTLENSDGRLANAVIENTAAKSAKTAKLDSLQSVNAGQIENGADYIGIMRENLNTLKEALK